MPYFIPPTSQDNLFPALPSPLLHRQTCNPPNFYYEGWCWLQHTTPSHPQVWSSLLWAPFCASRLWFSVHAEHQVYIGALLLALSTHMNLLSLALSSPCKQQQLLPIYYLLLWREWEAWKITDSLQTGLILRRWTSSSFGMRRKYLSSLPEVQRAAGSTRTLCHSWRLGDTIRTRLGCGPRSSHWSPCMFGVEMQARCLQQRGLLFPTMRR